MPPISDPIGRVLGKRYRLLSALGTGASAHVYLAEDTSLQRYVAVKLLQPTFVSDEKFLKRFRAESRSVASLNHPHVLRVFDWGEGADGPYLVLEYLGGGSMRSLLDQGAHLDFAQVATIGAEAASGLAYAHARGIVHRDIKPANLLFDEEGRVRVADFGVARALAEAQWTEPTGAMIGTVRYASPEQAQGSDVDGRSDVYSLALVLYETLTGAVPFTTDTPMGTLMARVGATLPDDEHLGPMAEILRLAAAPEPANRLDAGQFRLGLESIAAQLPAARPLPIAQGIDTRALPAIPEHDATRLDAIDATRTDDHSATMIARAGPGELFDVEAIEGRAGVPPPPVIARRKRRRALPWVVAAVVLAVALAVTGVVLYRSKVFTPSHPVPSLGNLSLSAARQAVTKDHFSVVVSGHNQSKRVRTGEIVSQQPARGASLKEGSTISVVLSSGPPSESIQALTSLDCTGAQRVLAAVGVQGTCPTADQQYSTSVKQGDVISWTYQNENNPTVVPYGATVTIVISKGPAPVTLPSSYGSDTFDQLAQTLQGLGLQVTQTQAYSNSVPAGQVIGTQPAAGSQAPYGSTVTVIVSQGPQYVAVPDVSGEKVSKAESDLQAKGFTIGQIYGPHPNNGNVILTSPAAGSEQPVGTAITVYVT